MRQIALLLLPFFLISCGITEPERSGTPRTNLEMEAVRAYVLRLSSDTASEIGVDIRITNTTGTDVRLGTGRFVFSPDDPRARPATAANPPPTDGSACQALALPPGTTATCSLVFVWVEPQPLTQVAPGSVLFADTNTGAGGATRVEALE